MSLIDYMWLLKLIIEILKLIAQMSPEERGAIAQLRKDSESQIT